MVRLGSWAMSKNQGVIKPRSIELPRPKRQIHATRRWGWGNMKLSVSLMLLLAAVAVAPGQDISGEGYSRSGIPLEVNRYFGSILIRAQVNGHPATLLVDTGSSHTIVASELLQVRPLALEHADAPAKGSGYVGRAAWAKATIEVGTLTWRDRKVLVMNDFQELSNSMKQRVDGILGQDALKEFDSVVIDFKHRRLVLSP